MSRGAHRVKVAGPRPLAPSGHYLGPSQSRQAQRRCPCGLDSRQQPSSPAFPEDQPQSLGVKGEAGSRGNTVTLATIECQLSVECEAPFHQGPELRTFDHLWATGRAGGFWDKLALTGCPPTGLGRQQGHEEVTQGRVRGPEPDLCMVSSSAKWDHFLPHGNKGRTD